MIEAVSEFLYNNVNPKRGSLNNTKRTSKYARCFCSIDIYEVFLKGHSIKKYMRAKASDITTKIYLLAI